MSRLVSSITDYVLLLQISQVVTEQFFLSIRPILENRGLLTDEAAEAWRAVLNFLSSVMTRSMLVRARAEADGGEP